MDLTKELQKAGHTVKSLSPTCAIVTAPSKTQRLGLTLAALNMRFSVKITEERVKDGLKVSFL